ncbi:MAG: hypothetical protein ACLRWM_11505 [Streptococcus sp.]
MIKNVSILYVCCLSKVNPENIHKTAPGYDFYSSQSMIISDDGFNFDNLNQKQLIIPVFKDGEVGHPVHTRDPKVVEIPRYLLYGFSK